MKFTEKVKSVNEFIPGAIAGILGKIRSGVQLPDDDVLQLRLILEEALTNAVGHGNRFDLGRFVMVDIEFENKTFVITVADEGKGFDPASVPDPKSATELKSRGRGIYLIKEIADEVRFNDKGNVITIVKKFPMAS